MDKFIAMITEMATKYLDNDVPSELSVALAIEQYKDCRNYPSTYTDEMILADMQNAKNKIAMAVAEIDAKVGIEGHQSFSENGISRNFGNNPLPKAYATVTPFVNVI